MSFLALCSLRAERRVDKATLWPECEANRGVCECVCPTEGQSVRALGGNSEGDNEVRAGRVTVNECGTVSSELQNAVDDLHHLRGVRHRPARTQCELLILSIAISAISKTTCIES